MAKWTEAPAADLKHGSVFRFMNDPEGTASRVTARWDEDGEVKLFSHDAFTDRVEGRSAMSPDLPVLILT